MQVANVYSNCCYHKQVQLFNLCELKIGKLKDDSEAVPTTHKDEILNEIGLYFPQFVGDADFLFNIWTWKCQAELVIVYYCIRYVPISNALVA